MTDPTSRRLRRPLRALRAAVSALVFVITGPLAASAPLANAADANVVNIYSARHYDTDLALYDAFTEKTGIQVNRIEGSSDALIERLVNEDKYTPADILVTVDAGRLWRARERGVFQPVTSATLNERVPEYLRDPDGLWFGLSKRARIIVTSKVAPPPFIPARYEDLADPRLRGSICMRSSSNIYNLSLMASMIASMGAEAAEDWAEGVVANFKRKPQGNDTSNVKAVASGQCGITLTNTYYLGRWLDGSADDIVKKLNIVFPNQGADERGTHVNVSGAGVTRHAPHRANAIRFLEYLTSEAAQRVFAEGNHEYPVFGETTGPIKRLGPFDEDDVSANDLGVHQAEAVRVYDRAGWR